MTHYKQIIINMSVEDQVSDQELEQIKDKIEKCMNENTNPDKIKEINVHLN